MLSSACALALGLALGASTAPAGQASSAVDRPFHQLASNLRADARALGSGETAAIAAGSAVVAALLHPADDDLSDWVERGPHPAYTRLGSFAGDGWVQAGAAVATYGIGRLRGNAAATHVGADLIRAQLLNGIATRGLKLIAHRKRPGGGGDSMPSGHSSAAFTSAAVLAGHFGWKVAVPAYATAGFIGWTRVRDNAHWATDVLIGGALGTLIGRAVTRRHEPGAWTVVPAASTTGASLFVVRN